MATTTLPRTARRDPLIAELLQDYGFKTERELRAQLRAATVWANERGVEFMEPALDDATGFIAELGPMVSNWGDKATRMKVRYVTGGDDFACPAHRRLLRAALALFLFTHPVTRRAVESGQFLRLADLPDAA